LGVQNDRRAWEFARAQMYLTLRAEFLGIPAELGDLADETPPTGPERMARVACWHHSYDEWRVSRLAPKQFGDFWGDHFKKAIMSGYAHPALRATFDELRADTKAGFGAYSQDFIKELLEEMPDPGRR
jgi:hypothetical protein